MQIQYEREQTGHCSWNWVWNVFGNSGLRGMAMTVDSYGKVKNGSSSLNGNVKGHLKCVRVSQIPAV